MPNGIRRRTNRAVKSWTPSPDFTLYVRSTFQNIAALKPAILKIDSLNIEIVMPS